MPQRSKSVPEPETVVGTTDRLLSSWIMTLKAWNRPELSVDLLSFRDFGLRREWDALRELRIEICCRFKTSFDATPRPLSYNYRVSSVGCHHENNGFVHTSVGATATTNHVVHSCECKIMSVLPAWNVSALKRLLQPCVGRVRVGVEHLCQTPHAPSPSISNLLLPMNLNPIHFPPSSLNVSGRVHHSGLCLVLRALAFDSHSMSESRYWIPFWIQK